VPREQNSPKVVGYGDTGTSLVFILPLLLLYQIGVLFADAGNGVDFVTGWLFALVGRSPRNYLFLNLSFAVVMVGVLMYLRGRRGFRLAPFTPLLLESGIYALTLGSFIVFVMEHLLGFDGLLALGHVGNALVISLGAGVHEELVFRLGVMGGGAYVLRVVGLPSAVAVGAALGVSALLFSAAHHVGPFSDPLDLGVFTYRALAGAVFGLLFYFRSLAHAVYTHFLYDLYVILLRS
jgi:hypothetical protein